MPFDNLGFEDVGTIAGIPDLWAPTQTGDQRLAAYGDGGQPAVIEPPFESFRGEWLSNEDFKTAFAGVPTDLEAAVYDTGPGLAPEGVEDFEEGWDNGIFSFVSGVNASYDALTFVEAVNPEPYALAVADDLSLTTNVGGPAVSTAVAATRAINTGAGGTFPSGFEGSNLVRITVDEGLPLAVDLGIAQNLADIIGLINAAFSPDIAVDNGGELELRSPTEGNVSRINAEEIQAARATATNPAPYALADGQTLNVTIDGGAPQVVTFNTVEFGNIAAATAFEVAQAIIADLGPGTADGLFGLVRVISETTVGSSVDITGGTAAAAFAFPAGVQDAPLARLGITPGDTVGGGNVRDLSAVTADEIAALVNGAAAIQAINAEIRAVGGVPRAYSTVPNIGTIAVNASAIQTAIDFTPTTSGPTGRDADTAEDFEDEWLSNEDFFLEAGDITLTAAVFDTAAPEAVEDFEEEWRSNQFFAFDVSAVVLTTAFYDPDPIVTPQAFEDFEEVRFDVTFSVTVGTDVLTSIAHLLVTDTSRFTVRSEGGQLPSPMLEETTYYAEVVTANTFGAKEVPGLGPVVIDLTTPGTGTLFLKYSKSAFWTEDLGI